MSSGTDSGDPDAGEPAVVAMVWMTQFTVEDKDETDLPRFALYSDRSVLYVRREGDGDWVPRRAVLERERFKRLRAGLGPTDEFLALDAEYDVDPCMMDAPEVRLFLAGTKGSRLVKLRGYHWAEELEGARILPCSAGPPDELPRELVRVLDLVLSEVLPDGERWVAEEFRVFVRPWLYRPEVTAAAMAWPEDWPAVGELRKRAADCVWIRPAGT